VDGKVAVLHKVLSHKRYKRQADLLHTNNRMSHPSTHWYNFQWPWVFLNAVF